ncbi:glycogen debranching N-terminal domain-containing protein [Novosphingopyxis sp.]|uniref:amylo-alpha-1,6-glucosidase n=1 Tax=Novosphingopyxis sp. TaxID=2709690 RepID=UPI003B5C3051
MAYEISVGPAQLTIHIGECVLITETDGQIRQPSERGLFYRDTRVISEWEITVDGRPWQALSAAAVAHYAAQVVMTNPALPTDTAALPAGSISLTIGRMLGLGGMCETLTMRNHNRTAVRILLAARMRCDFADIFDVKSHQIISRGETITTWSAAEGRLDTLHTNDDFRRGVSVSPAPRSPVPTLQDGALGFLVELAPQASWQAELLYRLIDGTKLLEASSDRFAEQTTSAQARASDAWCEQAMQLRSSYVPMQLLFEQSLDDLAALRLPIEGTNLEAFVPAAGIPWFAALFGRDSLVTALQTVPVYPDFARGALEVLARYQADGTDDNRDMQPGKIPHELRNGELAALGLVPYRPYYGTADATPLYLILLHQTWRFTGDDGLIRTHLGTAERCLRWIDDYGDLDGDGFQEYRRLAPDGAENQGWKDSGNGVLDEAGDDVPAPKALCELQGYVYDAWRRMAEVFETLGQAERATALRGKAQDLFDHFNAVFWDDEQQFYALCLNPAKRPVMSISSNPGHLLWSGIVPQDRAAAVVRRLMADDMWSGWGVRTLSAAHPAYNPHDYQLGAIWPHDNGLIALGFKRYGFHAEAARIVKGMVDAGSRFLLHRLPEVFAGTGRDDTPFPVQYLGANVPQAWAAGAMFTFVRALLGAGVDLSDNIVSLDPFLPDWLPDLHIEGLHVGCRRVDLHVWRQDGETRASLSGDPAVKLVIRSVADTSQSP